MTDHSPEACNLRFTNVESRLSKLEDKLEERTQDIPVIKEQIRILNEKFDKVDLKLTQILEKPSKRWDLIVGTFITSAVTFLISYFTLRK